MWKSNPKLALAFLLAIAVGMFGIVPKRVHEGVVTSISKLGNSTATIDRTLEPKKIADGSTDQRPFPSGAVARLGILRNDKLYARNDVRHAHFFADGSLIAASSQTRSWQSHRIWDVASGKAVGELPKSIPTFQSVSLSPDGRRIAWSTGDDSGIGVSNRETGEVIWRKKGGNSVFFTPDGFVIGSQFNGPILVFDATTGEVVRNLTGEGRCGRAFAISGDGKTATAWTGAYPSQPYPRSGESKLEVWDTTTGRLIKVLSTRSIPSLLNLAISYDGKKIAYLETRFLIVADVETGIEQWRIESSEKLRHWMQFAFSPDGKSFASIHTVDGYIPRTKVELLDAKSGHTLHSLGGDTFQYTFERFSPDGRYLVTYGENNPLRAWDTGSGHLLQGYGGHRSALQFLAMSADGSKIVSSDNYSICVWDRDTQFLKRSFDTKRMKSVGMSAAGQSLIGTTDYAATNLFDMRKGVYRTIPPKVTWFSAISPDGSREAIYTERGIEILDTGDDKVLHVLAGHHGELYSCVFSIDGRLLFSAAKTRPRTPSLGNFPDPSPPIPDDTLRVWNLDTGKEIRKWERVAEYAGLSADGNTMFAGCKEGLVRRMKVDTGIEGEPLAFHKGPLKALAISNGSTIAASADEHGIVVWDQTSGKEVKRYFPDHGPTTCLALSGDGRWLTSGGTDGTILVWEILR